MNVSSSSSDPPSSRPRGGFTDGDLIPNLPLKAGETHRHAVGAVCVAMFANFVIAALKGVGAWMSGSVALQSEALHSFADGFNSLILLFGIIRGRRAPDRTHPFGYGLEANLWALSASVLLAIGAILSFKFGLERLSHPDPLMNFGWAVAILIASLIFEGYAVFKASTAVLEELRIKATVWSTLPKALKSIHLVKGPTTRFVFYEDAMALFGVLLALVALLSADYLVRFGLLSPSLAHIPDAVASMLIALMLAFLALNLFWFNRGFLTGAAAPPNVEEQIRAQVNTIHGVSHVHNLKTIDQGISGLIVHMTVEVDPDIPVKDVDDLTERIKDKLQERIPMLQQVFIEVLADEREEEFGEQYQELLQKGRASGVLGPRDEALLRKAYDFTESVVRDVMIPRIDVVAVEVSTDISEVADLMSESGHTRLPVYEDNVDELLGFVHSRDVFDVLRKGQTVPLKTLVRELDIYPVNKPVIDLLEDLKRKKIRMAAVADEHGGFAGLVTIEDLMEEIVGEIWDEHDVEELQLEMVSPNKLQISGKYNIEDLNQRYELNIPTDEFVTVGGYVFGILGREPEVGDKIEFEDLTLTVAEAEGARIITVTIEGPQPFTQENVSE